MIPAIAFRFFTRYINIPLNYLLFGVGTQVNLLGEGSDKVPPIISTQDGSAYRDLRDPTNQWRDQSGNPLDPVRQAELQREWAKAIDKLREDIDQVTIPKPLPFPAIDPTCNKNWNGGATWTQPRDPLILDLDNDGIELTTSNSAILFDHNADGIKTGTQWAKADDGILVRDLNGNGTIDSGRELFGDQTQISSVNAAGQTITTLAAHGFAALKALDKDAAGLSDGIFNASDVAYAELKIWRDLNQDGVSQSNELLGLAESGVSAINLTQSATQVTQGKSTFTKTISGVDANGNPVSTSTEQTVQNVNFSTNNFYRAFSDNPVVTEAAAALPQMQGAGLVRDLREAMSLGTGQAAALQASLGVKSNSAAQAGCQKRWGLRQTSRCRFSVGKSTVVPKMGCIYSKKWF